MGKLRYSYIVATLIFLACMGSFLWVNLSLTKAQRETTQMLLLVSEFDQRAAAYVRMMRNELKTLDRSGHKRLNQILYVVGLQVNRAEERLHAQEIVFREQNLQLNIIESLASVPEGFGALEIQGRLGFLLDHAQTFTDEVQKFPEPHRQTLIKNANGVISLFDRQVAPYFSKTSDILTRRMNLLNKFSANLAWIFGGIMGAIIATLLFAVFVPMERKIVLAMDGITKAMERAKAADKAKSEFLANMSHEIRTPMNGVMGMAELLQKTELNQKQTAFADVIVKSGNALLTIINDILDFSKIDAGQMELDPAPFSMREAIEDVATLFSSKVAEKDLELIVRIDPDLPQMFVGDVGRIRQIAANLVGNSVKFTEEGHIFIDVNGRVEDGIAHVHFAIEDTGIGIVPDKVNKIFEKFSQVDESATRKHEGTGLGLAISSSLVRLMGGEMKVESILDRGSTFSFAIELPVHTSHSNHQRVPVDISGARVLIVDDNEVNRSILVENLNSWNFESAAASSGKEALAALAAMHSSNILPDCLILDYHMPNMNGAQLATAIRANPKLDKIPIVMLTSVDQMEDGKNFSSLGIEGHLVKPARASVLLETVIHVLEDFKSADSEIRSGVNFAKSMSRVAEREEQVEEAETYVTNLGVSAGPDLADRHDEDETASSDVKTSEESPYFAKEESTAETDSDISKIDILVAEDNEVNQLVIGQILQGIGYSYIIANNGEEAVELFRKYSPKLICMDVSMPVMNGHEATREIRQIEAVKGNSTPIIGVTAHAIKGDMERCFDSGMDDYLSKPVSPERLEIKIRDWMNGSAESKRSA